MLRGIGNVVRHRRSRRDIGLAVAALLVVATAVTTAVAHLPAVASTLRASAPIPGVPNVTGSDSTHGTVSIAELQAAAGDASVTASSVMSGGLPRGYLMIEPAKITTPLPLLVVLQGINASPTQEADRDDLLKYAAQGQAILLYPAGYAQSWNTGGETCCGAAATQDTNDVAFIKQLVATIKAKLPVSKTYLVGYSNGGKMAYEVMCQDPQLFAAFAVIGAAPTSVCTSASSDVRKSFMLGVGATDDTLLGTTSTEPSADVAAYVLSVWGAKDGCVGSATTVTTGRATATTTPCAAGTALEYVSWSGLAHDFPEAPVVGSSISGGSLIWQFFSSL